MKYVYKSLQVATTLFDPDICEPLDTVLNQQMEDGWELVAITPHRDWAFIVTFRKAA